jgi:hypothetical protein
MLVEELVTEVVPAKVDPLIEPARATVMGSEAPPEFSEIRGVRTPVSAPVPKFAVRLFSATLNAKPLKV